MEKLKAQMKKTPWMVVPIIIVMAIIPLVVRYHEFESKLSVMSWYVSEDTSGDMFNYYKSEFLVVMAGIMIMMTICGLIFSKKLSWHKAMIPLALYALMVVISTLVSDYQYFSLNGIADHFETTYVLLTYCLLVLFCYWFVDSERAVKFVIYGWMVGITIMGIFGLFQLFEHDIYSTDFGKWLIIPKELRAIKDIVFNFEPGMVYLTVYNPNYVGFYATLTIPILTTMYIFSKKKVVKAISITLNSVVFLCLMGSGARNGMIALFVALVCMLVIFRKKLKEYKDQFLLSYASMILIFGIFNILNGGMVTERLEAGFQVEQSTGGSLEDITTNEDNVVITYGGNDLVITMDLNTVQTEGIKLVDQDGNVVEQRQLDNADGLVTYEVVDERFPFTTLIGQVGGCLGFGIEMDGKLWCFSNQTGYDGYYFFTPYGKYTKIEKAESAIFTNYPNLASGRGYLWARTIPLLKNYLLVGSGPDTFTVVFPQKDYVAASELGYDRMTVTKPHNLYLQIGTQTGVVSLIAFLVFNIIYLLECVKLYWKKTADSTMEYIGVAIMIAIIGYLISGIINDSTVTVAPIYWCLMGIGLAVNRMVKKPPVTEDEAEENPDV